MNEAIKYEYNQRKLTKQRYDRIMENVGIDAVVMLILEYLGEIEDHNIILKAYGVDMHLVDGDLSDSYNSLVGYDH